MGGGKSKISAYKFTFADDTTKPVVADWIGNPVKDGKRIANKNLCLEQFQVAGYIGKGRSSMVRLCKYSKNQKYYAVKYIAKSWAAENNKADQVRNELEIHSKLSNRFIANFFATFQNHSYVFIVLDYAIGNSIERFMRREMNLGVVKFYCTQVCAALTYLHKVANVAHRDLNPSNIMVSQLGHVKLVDFGSAVQLSPFQTSVDTADVLVSAMPEYCAPELLPPFKKPGTTGVLLNMDQKHSYEVDWWAFGVLFYRMVTARFPFGSTKGKKKLSRSELFSNIFDGRITIPSKFVDTPGLEELVAGLLRKNTVTRYMGSDFERSPVMKGIRLEMAHKYVPPFIPPNKLVEGDTTCFVLGPEPPHPRPLERKEFALADYSKTIEEAMTTSMHRGSSILTTTSRGSNAGSITNSAGWQEINKKSSKAAVKRFSRRISTAPRASTKRNTKTELVPNGPAPAHA